MGNSNMYDGKLWFQEIDPTVPDWAKQPTKPIYTKEEVGLGSVDNVADLDKHVGFAKKAECDAHGHIIDHTYIKKAELKETDPTVPAWAKKPEKPSYSKEEVGLGNVDNTADEDKQVAYARRANCDVNGDIIDQTYLKVIEFTETDPTVPTWAKESEKPSYTKEEVGLGNVDNIADVNKSVAFAKNAECDADGEIITNTYLKKSDFTAEYNKNVIETKNGELIDSLPLIRANTEHNKFAGALAVKALDNNLTASLNGCKITYENGDFYVTYGSVKKKLGEMQPRIVTITDGNTITLVNGVGSSTLYAPDHSFEYTKKFIGHEIIKENVFNKDKTFTFYYDIKKHSANYSSLSLENFIGGISFLRMNKDNVPDTAARFGHVTLEMVDYDKVNGILTITIRKYADIRINVRKVCFFIKLITMF